MKPIELEIIMKDSTRQGMQSVTGNVDDLNQRISQQNTLIKQLEGDLRSMQAAFEKASKSGDQSENIAMVSALKKEVAGLKAELLALEKQQKKTSSAPAAAPAASPVSGLKEQITEVKANIKYMEDYVKQYEKSMKSIAPGKEKAIMTQELNGAKDALLAEKDALAQLESQMGSAGQKQTTLRTQIAQLKQEMAMMTEGTEEYYTAMERLGEMQDQYSDIGEQGRIFADDNKEIEATMDAVSGLSGVMAAGVGVASLFGVEEEKLAQIQTKLQAVMAITMGVQQVANTLNKDSYFMHVILGRAKKMLITANELEVASNSRSIVVTKLATIAQWAHNKAVMANPYVAAAIAVIAVVAAIGGLIYAYTRWSSGARDAEREQNRLTLEIERTKSAINQLSEDVDFDVRIAEASGASKSELLSLRKEAAKTALALADINFDKINDKFMSGKATKEQMEQARSIAQDAWGNYNKVMQDAVVYDVEKKKGKKSTDESKESLLAKASDADLKARQKIEAMKIDIMQKGAAKEKAAARLRFDEELARIDKEEKERLAALEKSKKNGLPVTKEQVTTVTDQSNTQRKLASEVYVKEFLGIEKDYADTQQKKFDTLVNKYQDYTAQRVDIETKFNKDLAALDEQRAIAVKNGDTKQVDQIDRAKAQAITNKGKELIGLDYQQLKETPDYVRAFENLKETSSATLESLLAQLEHAKSAAAEVLSPDQLREYTTTIQEIMDELDARNPFGALADRKAELAEAEAELATAQQQLIAVQGGAKIETGVKNTKFNEKTGKIESEKTYLTTAKAMEKYSKAQDNVTKKGAKVEKAEKEVKDVMDDLFNSIKDVGDAIGGPAGEIVSLIGDIGLFAMTAMSGVETASKTASTSIQTVEKASVILAIIGAAIQIAMKIASLFKDDDGVAAYERAADVYESYIDILDRVIEKQKELFELNSKTGEQAYEKAKEAVGKQDSSSRELGKQYLNSGASKGFLGIGSSASEGVKQRDSMSWQAKEDAKKALGESAYNKAMDGRMTGLFDLTAKQLEDLQRDAPLFWAELHDDTQKYLQQIIDCNEELTQLEKDRKEGLTKVDFDSFYSGFLDTLNDMDASSEDFANSFEDYMKNAILSSLLTNQYKSRIQALYDNWAASTQSGNELTEAEAEVLRKEQETIAADMLKKREELAKTFGWQSETEKEQQAGKSGAFTTMSQDQGTKLEGLFTSVQGHVSNIDDLVKDINRMMYLASDMLAEIVRNTGYCKFLEDINNTLSRMDRDGVKMK